MSDYRPPQITENEAHIWQALGRAASAAEEASFALARARQMILRHEPSDHEAAFWNLATTMLHSAGRFASETLAERQRLARQPKPEGPDARL